MWNSINIHRYAGSVYKRTNTSDENRGGEACVAVDDHKVGNNSGKTFHFADLLPLHKL
ncbi:hypothetical protein SDC9_73967 [bioreactor metagenome]|uniref:Uncharacterized protein n=1 Tax=bioreactor metagenome TaxID=1076179 RepID=A0A644YG24_9ZZZZ